ncbi:MAG: Uma2 family endonuclease [Methylococcaceae bacterium]
MQWQEVLADKSLQNLPYKIELNQYGKIEMSPNKFLHSYLRGELISLLSMQLDGNVFSNLAIKTTQGIKVADIAWSSDSYYQQHKHDIAASSAPEICVEIISPSNSKGEMKTKIDIYLKAGAIEVWLVNEQGLVSFFNKTGEIETSSFNISLHELIKH